MANKLHLITAIVQHKLGNAVIDAALKAGAAGATSFFAQGTGVRQTLGAAGSEIEVGKRIVHVLLPPAKTQAVLKAVTAAGELDKAGGGVAYVQEVSQAVGLTPSKG
jgi:nitrogen regulatory protein PII